MKGHLARVLLLEICNSVEPEVRLHPFNGQNVHHRRKT